MRKRSAYRQRPAKAPMLVVMQGVPELSLTERMSVEAIAGGWATTDHFDNLADCRNMLMLAAAERSDNQTQIAAELGFIALSAIMERHKEIGRMVATGEELKALRVLVDTSEDFWKRQSGALFQRHYDALRAARPVTTA